MRRKQITFNLRVTEIKTSNEQALSPSIWNPNVKLYDLKVFFKIENFKKYY